jgi:precorrin-6B C5,15-methyltransferase / cobalt-precorrin-6B C5,C15-methyltransferase
MITIVGMDGSALSPQAEAALASATLVVGAQRHLTALPALATVGGGPGPRGGPGDAGAPDGAGDQAGPGVSPAVRVVALGELGPALDALAAHEGDAVVLASGDPGFFGIVRALCERGLPAVVLPAVSSVALAFARAGLPWDDAVVVSAHGRDPRPALSVCRAHPKVAVLTGPGAGPAEIGAALAGWNRRLLVCEQLGSPAERITECSPAGAADQTWADPNVVVVLAETNPVIMGNWSLEKPQSHDHEAGEGGDGSGGGAGGAHGIDAAGGLIGARRPGWAWPRIGGAAPLTEGWALGEGEFDSRDAVITKAEVRALALARLAPGPGLLVWDVGAGCGSIAVECARFGAAVIAVERDSQRCDRIRGNAARHAVDVRVQQGEAPGAFDGLPTPDAVFVGGGGPAAVEAVAGRRPARIVVALAAIERAGPTHAALTAAGYAVDGALLQASRLAPLPGDVHRLAATNPVFVLWATAPGPHASALVPGPAAPPGRAQAPEPPAQGGPP